MPTTFQRTAFETILADIEAKLAAATPPFVHFVALEEAEPDAYLGDQQVVIRPGALSPDPGTTEGTGTMGNIVHRDVELILMTRSYLDEGGRGRKALLAHLAKEELLLTTLHLYMPTNANGLLVEGFRLKASSRVTMKQGWLTTPFVFDACYPALLQSTP